MMFLFAFLFFGVDCRPHVAVSCQSEGINRNCSGTIYEETETSYYVVTCAHFIDYDHAEACDYSVTLYSDQLSPTLKAELIKFSEEKDIAVLKIAKYPSVRVKPLKIADSKLPTGTECIGYGYTPDYQRRSLSIDSYTLYNAGENNPLLNCRGSVISGMSGGALIYQNQIFGLLSTSCKEPAGGLYVPSSEIISFLETL